MHYCAQPGCGVLVRRGRCAAHLVRRENYRARRWYCTARWFTLRAQVLLEAAYTCAVCERVTQRLEVDHITKHQGNPALFWDRANLQALCPSCHYDKTRRGA